jgi:HK97 family phage major capsid protein
MALMQAGAMVLPLESDSNIIGRLAGGPTFIGSHGENVQESTTTLTFDAVQLVPKTVMCVLRMSDEWMQDAVNGGMIIEETLIREMAAKLDEYGLAGTGSGQPTGLVNFTGVNTVTQAPSTMDYDDVFDAITECRKDHVEPTGWIISATNANILNQLKVNSEANNYAWPPVDIQTLPKYVTESIGNDHVVVGDFSQFIWAIRQDIVIKRESQIDRNSQLISVTARVDFAAMNAPAFCVISA